MIKVLIKFAHGLGDTVQLSVVLRHLAIFHPDWQITVHCGRGKHTALLGLCHQVIHDQEREPNEHDYAVVFSLMWFENYCRYLDRPNTKVTNTLTEVFNLPWMEDLGRYQIKVRPDAVVRASKYLQETGCRFDEVKKRFQAVLLHYEGNTSQSKKNLSHWQAREICFAIQETGRVPVLLDWDRRSPLPDQKTIFCPRAGQDDIWGGFGSGDAEILAALISLSEAFIGIDSGPGKVASATDTPTLIHWLGHHPMQFHDPAANTVHLIPENHRTLPPCVSDERIVNWFMVHYAYLTYKDPHDQLTLTAGWLSKTLDAPLVLPKEKKRFVLPGGIGDCMWALLKLQGFLEQGEKADIILAERPGEEIGQRAVPFLKRFDFVGSVEVSDIPIHVDKDHAPTDEQGRYRYLEDGPRYGYHYLIPNRVLEHGQRLETWHPDVPLNWDVLEHFSWENTERGSSLAKVLSPFAAFYLGPETGHTNEGHNYNWLWQPHQWLELGKSLRQSGLRIAVVGAPYDRSFWERYVRPGVQETGQHWLDLIGRFEIGETLAFLRQARVLVSYQCGLGIVAHYLGVPTIMWWRPDGNSGHPTRKLSFDNRMRNSWVRPGWEEKYLGCLYNQENVNDILTTIDVRGWLR